MLTSAPILATKLYIPPPPPKIVVRNRLIERLDEGLSAGQELILISAPAGSGTTRLVNEWIASRPRRLARATPLSYFEYRHNETCISAKYTASKYSKLDTFLPISRKQKT